MSHPNPHHDPENVYPSDHYRPKGSKSKDVKKQFNKTEHEKAMLHTMSFRAKSKALSKAKKSRSDEHEAREAYAKGDRDYLAHKYL